MDNLARFDDPVALNNAAELIETASERSVDQNTVEDFAAAFAKSSSRPLPEAEIRDLFERSTALALATRERGFRKAADQVDLVRATLNRMLNPATPASANDQTQR
jgi:hypothetical protein